MNDGVFSMSTLKREYCKVYKTLPYHQDRSSYAVVQGPGKEQQKETMINLLK